MKAWYRIATAALITITLSNVILFKYIKQHEDTKFYQVQFAGLNKKDINEDITLVTAFIDIGDKGHGSHRSNQKYYEWMKFNRILKNPMVAFFNTKESYDVFNTARQPNLNITISHMISTDDLWSFNYKDEIHEVLQRSSNAGFIHPRLDQAYTAEYMCTMTAKYEFLQTAIKDNPFKTKYFAWIDIAHLRNFRESTDYIHLPDNFDITKVAYQEAYPFKCGSEYDIFHRDIVWLGGQLFIATGEVMLKWINIYVQFIEYYISKSLMNSDEQVLLAMYCHHYNIVGKYMQPYYAPDNFFERRMYMTHLCRLNGDKILGQKRSYDV